MNQVVAIFVQNGYLIRIKSVHSAAPEKCTGPTWGRIMRADFDGSNPKQIATALLSCGLYFVP